jgi:hypothetical protein
MRASGTITRNDPGWQAGARMLSIGSENHVLPNYSGFLQVVFVC